MLRLGVYADKHHQSFAPSNIIHHYIDVVDHVLLPFLLDGPFADGCFVLEHDRSPAHQATAVQIYLEEQCINSLQWPPGGANLN
ncbi:hypothetical protein HPB47_006064, partial [Ixodes persulcatus]